MADPVLDLLLARAGAVAEDAAPLAVMALPRERAAALAVIERLRVAGCELAILAQASAIVLAGDKA